MQLKIGREDLLPEFKGVKVGEIRLKHLKPEAVQAVLAYSAHRFDFVEHALAGSNEPYYQPVIVSNEELLEYGYLDASCHVWLKDEMESWLHTWDDDPDEDDEELSEYANYPNELAALVEKLSEPAWRLTYADLQLIVFHLYQKFSDGG